MSNQTDQGWSTPITAENKVIADRMGRSWWEKIGYLFNTKELQDLAEWIAERRQQVIIYPENKELFRAFHLCPFGNTKVIILGQDPYHDKNADGLAFSCKNYISPSLSIILKELEKEYPFPESPIDEPCFYTCKGDLSYWATQGVLLLNTSLTVEAGKPKSHKGYWDTLIKAVLNRLIYNDRPKVFMAWGSEAKYIMTNTDFLKTINSKHKLLLASHPMTEVYQGTGSGGFYGSDMFRECNQFLRDTGQSKINW